MISANEFRNGSTIELDGEIFTVIEFQHVKPGKGGAFVRTKIKNLITGSIIDKTFRPTEKMPKAYIERKEMQYLYKDGELYYFMDTETYDQIAVNIKNIKNSLKFVKENEIVKILSYKDNIFDIEPPLFAELKVIETEPGIKGNTVQGATKHAVVETGYTVNVPTFINKDDIIKIDTKTGEYLGRISS